MAQGPSDTILVVIRITLRIRESKVRNPDPPDRRRFVLCECILVCYLFMIREENLSVALAAGVAMIISIAACVNAFVIDISMCLQTLRGVFSLFSHILK